MQYWQASPQQRKAHDRPSRHLQWLALFALQGSLVGLLFRTELPAGLCWFASLACCCYGAWLNWRLQLDAALFAQLESAHTNLEQMDYALAALFGCATKPERNMASRLQGARRLLLRYLASVLLATLLALSGWGLTSLL